MVVGIIRDSGGGRDCTISNEAVDIGDLTVLTDLLQIGCNPNLKQGYFGNTALHLAAANGHTAMVDLLLNHEGIDINARDNDDRTPLYYAKQQNHLDIVQVLKDNGATE